MFLHVGNNKNIRVHNIIGIFDADNATISRETKKYLKEAQQAGLVEFANREEIPKSFVLYSDTVSDFAERGKFKVCFSQLSSSALEGRLRVNKLGEDSAQNQEKN